MRKTLLPFSAFTLVICFSLFAEPSVLNQNVKEVALRIQDLALYPNLSKKRLYGSVAKGSAIRFDLKSAESSPQSIGIGIATDGKMKDWILTVYVGSGQDENATILRKERITGESQWVFELLAPPEEIIVEIQNLDANLSLVEVVHGYYYGYSVDKENKTKPISNQQNQRPNYTESDRVTPNEVQNKVEFIRIPVSKD